MVAKRLWVLIAVLALALAACTAAEDTGATDGTGTDGTGTDGTGAAGTSGTTGGDAVAQRDYRFVVVTHGQSSDPFWSVAANGVTAAGEDMGVTVEYQAPGTFDMVEMASIIDAAVASEPDGLVVSLPDAEALGPRSRPR